MAENYFYSSLTSQEIERILKGCIIYFRDQYLTEQEKARARANIGAGTESSDFVIKGFFSSVEEMEESLEETPEAGDAYGIGSESQYDIYVWDGVHSRWVNNGSVTSSRFINDEIISDISSWSSQKINAELGGIRTGLSQKASIRDADTSQESTWSSEKIDSELDTVREDISEQAVRVSTITLTASNWSGTGPYTQTVSLPSGITITANTKVDLQPDAATIAQIVSDGVAAIYIDNTNGVLTAYAVDAVTTVDLTIYCTYYEVRQAS